jgi:Galactose oxidase-like, Early set domain/Kelch motif
VGIRWLAPLAAAFALPAVAHADALPSDLRVQPEAPRVRLADAGACLPRTQDPGQCSALPGSEDTGRRASGAARRARGASGWTLTPAEVAQYDYEAQIIGPEHAAEHLQERVTVDRARAAAGFDPCRPRGPASVYEQNAPLPPRDAPTGQARCLRLPRQPAGRRLAKLGRWSREIVDLPNYAIHAALLPTGKVIFWSYEWTNNLLLSLRTPRVVTSNDVTIWDPRKGAGRSSLTIVKPPRADLDGDGIPETIQLYCAGQTFLADGRLLIVGGTLDANWTKHGFTEPPGIKVVLVFDPRTQSWTRMPDMSVARWYPTVVKLADGRTLVLGGFDDSKPTLLTHTLESISPDARQVVHVPSADRLTWTYPGLMLMPDSNVLLEGPLARDTGLLDPVSMQWRPLAPLPETRGGENLVPVPTRTGASPRAMVIGGADILSPFDASHSVPAFANTVSFDDDDPVAGWTPAAPQNVGRNWPNTVLLPDGSMATVGGGSGITLRDGPYANTERQRHVELWDPRTARWRLGPAQREARAYHSVALLLPDGRVWSAGDDADPNRDGDTAELYEPPYLFRGARPSVVSAPRRVVPRRRFTVDVRGVAPVRVTMLAPSAVTHARDMNQRFVELRVVRRVRRGAGWRVTVAGPRSLAVAPPGPWMLFALSRRGAVSVARWTSVG